MLEFIILSNIYIPHGHCYLWQPSLVSLHLISDALISLSYYFIPIALIHFLNQRKDTPFKVVWFLFAAFIITCGTTHILSIITLWYPIYWISGFIKALTALVSIITAFKLISVIPLALALPNPTQLKLLNQELEDKTQFLQSVYEGVEQAIFVVDVVENGKFRYVSYNPAAEKFSGFSRSEIQGKTPDEFMPTASANLSIQQFQACARAKKSITVEECLYFQGKNSWFLTTLTPLKDCQGKIKQIIGTAIDINQRKQAEQKLQESEERFRRAFDDAAIGMALVSLEGHFLKVNQSLCELTGYSEAELLALDFQTITYPEDLESDLNYVKQLLAGEIRTYQMEKRYFHKNGEIIWVLLNGSLVRDEQQHPLYFIAQIKDITARKQAEQSLQRYKRIIAATSDAICLVDRNYTYQLVNQAYLNWHQKKKNEIVGHFVNEIIGDSEFYEIVKPNIDRCLLGENIQYERWFEYPNNKLKFMSLTFFPYREVNGEISGIVASLRNLTELKQAEEALRESEERLQLIASNIPGVMYTFVARLDGTFAFEYISEGCREVLEVEPKDALADANLILDKIHAEDRRKYDEATTASMGNLTPFSSEWRQILSSGRIRQILGNSRPKRRENGETVWHGVILDISDRKAAEAELVKAKVAAEVASQAKSIFLANMSHELRSPLNAILGFAQVLSGSSNLTRQQQNNLNIIQRSGEHLLSLINEILDLSKIEAGQSLLIEEAFDLWQLIEEIKDLFRIKASQKHLQLIFTVNPNLPRYIQSDRVKLRQILINLLSNGIKFTTKGQVSLEADLIETSFVSMTREAETSKVQLHFRISDTGVGIASDELDHLFRPFVQTQSGLQSRQGTGLGLAICHGNIKLLGGKIEVDSQPNIGTTFDFEFPVLPVAFAETFRESSQTQNRVIGLQPNQPHYRILIVDDEPYNRRLLDQILTPIGFELQMANNGLEAIAAWQTFQPHLIFMDLKMPVLNGYEATRQIRLLEAQNQAYNDCKTIIFSLTASVFNEQREAAAKAGCDDFISKPLQIAIILNQIANHLGLKYIYEDVPHQSQVPSQKQDLSQVQSQLATSSSDWKTRLTEALLSLDAEEINHLITEVFPEKEELANYLRYHTDNFNYQPILKLLKVPGED